ncbi:MAG: endopeptidase La [Ezakiella sp.]|nr:endopeptidase La [Ezakiella sp.]MDD7472208.1 endopeptidase La [Bacillota bacterium]MDY3923201.1 endopeptidase La [Ezakiella sp.]
MDIYKENKINLPIIALRGISAFPNTAIHFDVGRPKSIRALEAVDSANGEVFLVTQKKVEVENPTSDDLFQYGTICEIKQVIQVPQGGLRVLVTGKYVGKLVDFTENIDYLEGNIIGYEIDEELEKKEVYSDECKALVRLIKKDVEDYIMLNPKIVDKSIVRLIEEDSPIRVANIASSSILLTEKEYQELLAEFDVEKKLIALHAYYLREIDYLKIEDRISARVREQMNKIQKEYYLREQIKAIQEELGEGENISAEIEEYKEKIDKINLPTEAREKAIKEANRLVQNSYNQAEAGIIRNYLDWILSLPWDNEKDETVDLNYAREVLDAEHYGLNDIKDRIVEFLAVKKLNPKANGNILLFVGPPGVGKTSIARSIAKAMDRDFVRMSLGGIRDEAEIRGHRRTYIGAMPGRIISGMKRAGSKNPVFLLDEIDKLSSDFRGDPASALLEVLDPEQNKTFVDNYLDLPFDLSNVFFVTTANSLNIPPALLDRMEVIRLAGYTDEEKINIAEKFLVKKQMAKNGVTNKNFSITRGAIKEIIEYYTREAGVRNLEREIASAIRKAAVKIATGEEEKVSVTIKKVEEYLGPRKFFEDEVAKKDQVGVTNGLAWTSVGGTTLQVEAIATSGSGKVTLTGQLGDVMKESAMAAVSYIRKNAKKLGVDEDFYKNTDLHIHVPEGAVPKDGPSAGVTMAVSILSALTGKPVDKSVAMTGEITLTGRVLPIGGLKEKVLAALRMGIKTVIVPEENKKDLVEIPEDAKAKITWHFVKDIGEVFKFAIK